MTVSQVAATMAGKELFKKTVSGVYDKVTKTTGRKILQWNTERKMEQLYRKIAQIRRVKTIWQVDKAVDLKEFYCDSHVIIGDTRKTVQQVSDLSDQNVLIEGIAGQGKSILLRYLCSVELAKGECIPVFVELRRVTLHDRLNDRIYAAFNALGLSVDDELFKALAESGKILLLLDAFDEVSDDLKQGLLTDIEDIINSNDKLRVIVTSRPNNTIRTACQFSVVTLDNLEDNEYIDVIQKLAAGQVWADLLITHVETQALHVRALLCTPLMVTLLVLCYKSYKKLPSKLSDFYDALFHTLLQRHDGTKPGFTRERRCKLDDSQYRQLFESLCINAKREHCQFFDHEKIYKITEYAVQKCSLNVNPESYLDDIVKITCLILRDGEEYRFIHKTVQEYYVAAFVAKQPEKWAIQFYTRLPKKCSRHDWRKELDFLSEIDTHRFNKYYLLPSILSFLDIEEKDLDGRMKNPTLKQIRGLMSYLTVSIPKDNSHDLRYTISGVPEDIDNQVICSIFMGCELHSSKMHKRIIKLFSDKTGFPFNNDDFYLNQGSGKYFKIRGDDLLDNVVPRVVYREVVENEYSKLFDRAKEISESVKLAEDDDFLDDLL
jgi:hypothetical protein